MACKPSCKLCRNLVISQSVTSTTIDGVATLLVDLPVGTYADNCKYCIIIAQTIPVETPISAVVAFTIGGDTTNVYPFLECDCSQVSACGIRTRTRYSTVVSTSIASGVFKSLGGLACYPRNNLASLPVPAATTTATTDAVALRARTTSTKKEVTTNA